MEDVLDLYHEEYDRECPVVCFDESSKQLLGDVPPIEAAPGRVERYDKYQRNGTRNLFMFCEPKGGWRHVEVTGRRTAVDFAQQMKWLVDEAYPDATLIRLVLDNLNTHKPGSLYEAFAPSEARRIAKLELRWNRKVQPGRLNRRVGSVAETGDRGARTRAQQRHHFKNFGLLVHRRRYGAHQG